MMESEVLESSNYSSSLLGGLRSLRLDDQLCDLTLVADSEEIRVHRAVVAASSDYFRALLTLDMREKGQDRIVLKGVPARGLKVVVNFIYTGKLHCSLDNISDVLVASTHLQQSEAIQLCNGYLAGLTNSKNCVDMYNLSETFGLNSVQHRALHLIYNNFEEISSGPDFYKFNQRFLGKVLSSDKLKITSELKLFQLILKWVNYNLEERGKHIGDLMQHVRFPLITPIDLVNHVMDEPLMRTNPSCLDLILEANKYHMLPERQAISQNGRTQVRTDRHSIVMLDIDGDGPKVLEVETRSWGSLGFTNIDTFHSQVCVLDNYMYICGGIDLYNSSNPVSAKSYRYDPRFDTWCDITPMQEPRHHFVLVGDTKSLYAIGGYCNGSYRNIVEQYKVSEDQWVYKSPIGVKLSASAAAYFKGRIYLSGGQNEQGILKCLWSYSVTQDVWVAKPPMPQARMDHAMCAYKNKLYVFGGYDKNIIKAFDRDAVESFDISTDQWSVIKTNCPKMSSMNACVIGTKVFVVGGFSYDENKKRKDVVSYDFDKGEWETVTKLQNPTMSVPTCVLRLPRHVTCLSKKCSTSSTSTV